MTSITFSLVLHGSRAQIRAIFEGQKDITKCLKDVLTHTKVVSETLFDNQSFNITQKRILSDANIEGHR